MSSAFFKVFSVCHFFQFHHLKSDLSCAQCPHSLLFHLILLKNIILSALQNLPAAALDKLAAFPKTKCSLSSIKGVLIDESNRNCQTDRRPWPRCHSQGDPPHHENPRGRPVTDNIGTVGKILLCNGRFSQTEWVEVVHNDENGSDDRRYSRGINNVTPPAKFDLSWRRCSSMGQSNKFKPSVLAPRGASTDGLNLLD